MQNTMVREYSYIMAGRKKAKKVNIQRGRKKYSRVIGSGIVSKRVQKIPACHMSPSPSTGRHPRGNDQPAMCPVPISWKPSETVGTRTTSFTKSLGPQRDWPPVPNTIPASQNCHEETSTWQWKRKRTSKWARKRQRERERWFGL